MPSTGPRLTARDKTRLRLGRGMVRKRVSKGVFVEIDVDPALLAIADGAAAFCQRVLDLAAPDVPDDPTTPGSRIRESGQFGVYAFGQALTVEGMARDFRKPKGFTPSPNGIDAVVTYRSRLHHLFELGWEFHEGRPYLEPAAAAAAASVPRLVRDHFPQGRPRIGGRGSS